MNPKLQLSPGIFLILLLVNPSDATTSYIDSLFSHSLGVYLEPIIDIQVLSEKYHFLSYLDLFELYNFKHKIIENYTKLTTGCTKRSDICNASSHKIDIKSIAYFLQQISSICNQTYNINSSLSRNDPFSEKVQNTFEKLEKNHETSLYLPEDNLFLVPNLISLKITNFSKIISRVADFNEYTGFDAKFNNSAFENLTKDLEDTIDSYTSLLRHLLEALTHTVTNSWHPILFPDSFLNFKLNLSTSFFFNILPFSKIKHFTVKNYLIFMLTIPVPSSDKFHLFKPHAFPIYFEANDKHTLSIHHKPQISYLALSSNNENYFIADDQFIESCYQTDIGTFCHVNHPIINTKENPICETSIITQAKPYKCQFFVNINKYHFWSPLQAHYGWLYSNFFPKQFQLYCPEKPDVFITIKNTGIIQLNPDCKLNPAITSYYPNKNLKILDSSIPRQKSTLSLSSISSLLYNYSFQQPHLFKRILFHFEHKEDMPLSLLEDEIFILEKLSKIPQFFQNDETLNFPNQGILLILTAIMLLTVILLGLLIFKIGKINKNFKSQKTTMTEIKHATPLSFTDKPLLDEIKFQF